MTDQPVQLIDAVQGPLRIVEVSLIGRQGAVLITHYETQDADRRSQPVPQF